MRGALLSAILLAGCSSYRATLVRTSYGVPHITAEEMGSLGFGEGYALAEDHACSVADQTVRVRGERALYFGRGEKDVHLHSDLAMRALEVREKGARDLEHRPAEIREWLEGYAAGFNHYLEVTGVSNLAGWCRGQEWVRPITASDVLAYARAAALDPTTLGLVLGATALRDPESNGWAIGGELSAAGRGMLLANPHYSWVGSNRFWEKHLTIPGSFDAYGVSVIGLPGVVIGLNRDLAWTATASAGFRSAGYLLNLVPGDPTSYFYDGKPRAMTVRTIRIDVREASGALTRVEKKVYFSHYGLLVTVPGIPWTREHAVAIREANSANDEILDTQLAVARAKSLEELKRALAKGGTPFVNTVAATADGRAWYGNAARTPHLSSAALEAWRKRLATDPWARAAEAQGLLLLDGSTSRDEWVDDPEAPDPGLVPFEKTPQMERRDYVFNANDSHWVVHGRSRLEGYSRLFGPERTALSLRTRLSAILLNEATLRGPDGRFSLDELAGAALSNRGLAAELLLRDVVALCRRKSAVPEACRILASYDGRVDLESVGAVLWREIITQFDPSETLMAGPLFAEDFDPADPVGTPRKLANSERVVSSLGRAVEVLRRAGIPLDVALGDVQYTNKYGNLTPVHGGLGPWEGVTNLIRYEPNRTTLEPEPGVPLRIDGSRFLTAEGYPVSYGTSFLMALEFRDDGPHAIALLTYSQSGDPDSPHFSDQTALYSQKKWRPILFSEKDVARDPNRSVKVVTARRFF